MKLNKARMWVNFRRLYLPFSLVGLILLGVANMIRENNYAPTTITYSQPQCWSICTGNPRDGFTCNPVPRITLPQYGKADKEKAS